MTAEVRGQGARQFLHERPLKRPLKLIEGIRIFDRNQPLGWSSCNYLGYEEVVTGTFVTLYAWPDLSETYNCPNVA